MGALLGVCVRHTHPRVTIRAWGCLEQALPPSEINFVPLSQTRSFRADQLLDFYRTDPSVKHIKPFTDIIYSSPVYPVRVCTVHACVVCVCVRVCVQCRMLLWSGAQVVYDSDRVVMSLPPIINGEHSKVCRRGTRVQVPHRQM